MKWKKIKHNLPMPCAQFQGTSPIWRSWRCACLWWWNPELHRRWSSTATTSCAGATCAANWWCSGTSPIRANLCTSGSRSNVRRIWASSRADSTWTIGRRATIINGTGRCRSCDPRPSWADAIAARSPPSRRTSSLPGTWSFTVRPPSSHELWMHVKWTNKTFQEDFSVD